MKKKVYTRTEMIKKEQFPEDWEIVYVRGYPETFFNNPKTEIGYIHVNDFYAEDVDHAIEKGHTPVETWGKDFMKFTTDW